MLANEKYIDDKQELDIDKTRFFEISGELYIKIDNNGQNKLLKYNDKYEKLVEIQFEKDSEKNIENKVIETLSSQYIEKFIYRR